MLGIPTNHVFKCKKRLFATLLSDYRFLTQESLDVLGTRKLNVEFNFMEHGQVKLFFTKRFRDIYCNNCFLL